MKPSLISRLQPLRLWLAPQGGRRDKLLRIIYYGLKTWRQEGLNAVYRKASQRISQGSLLKRLSARLHQTQKKRLTASLLDLRALSKEQLIPASYDILLLSGLDWTSPSQGPQQFVRRFALDGHRVFYLSATFIKGTKTKVRPLEKGIFEIQLSGSASMKLDSDLMNAQKREAFLSLFGALRNELMITDAICIVESPLWKPIADSLLDRFGWRMLDLSRWTSASQEWLNCFEQALQDNLLEDSQRLHSATQNTWEDRYAEIKYKIPALFPKASIVIVTYNNVEYTRLCLSSIYEKTIYPNFEVIVVDNASNNETVEFLKSFEAEHQNIQILYNARNEGFARANNLGIALAHGDYIVLLNNDTIVTRVWLSRLINPLRNPQIGLIGSLTNGVSNEAHVEMPFTDVAALDAFAMEIAKERADVLTPIKMLAMYCMAGRREIFQQIGPLDEQFGIGMFEDDDYSLRVRQAGYKIAVAEDVFIHHFGRSGFKILGDERYLALFEENRSKFEAKWNIKWEQHVSGTLADTRQYTADLQNILDRHPEARGVVIFPPTIGWNISLFQRPHQLARSFAKKGYLVFFCTEAPIDDLEGFREVNHLLYLANCPPAVFDLLKRPIIFTLPYNREYLFQLRQPIVVYEVIDDLDVFPGDKAQLQKNHDILLKEADVVLVTADRLMEQVKPIRSDALLCPNAVELDHFSQATESVSTSTPSDLASILKTEQPVIGYYGALARWFDYDLVREAAQRHVDWNFVLIGPNHDHTLVTSNLLALPNIHWLGPREYSQLPDYLRYFTVATIPFLVNNITLATSPIKLFEYMAAGKPIVTSDLPECRKYPGIFIAHNPKEYVDHLEHALTLTQDTAYIKQLYQTAQENTWEARVSQITSALEHHQDPKSLPMEPRR